MELELVGTPPFAVRARFELAAARIADAWIRTRRLEVTAEDFHIACDFLERDGWRVEELPGLRVRVAYRYFRSEEVTREDAVLVAFRRLALPAQSRARAAFREPEAPAPEPVTPVTLGTALVRVNVPPRSGVAPYPAESPASPF